MTVAAVVMWIVLHPVHGWMVDLCAGGSFGDDPDQAVAFRTEAEVWRSLDAAEISRDGLTAIAVRVP